ncbi:MAG: glycoside hydrolase family 26 protein [Prevotellaceae bacterium]|jgi:mannan endo-1,4-beta-mannosidase|nr:glycoside hydrolase family 26 protein [Prevotellaceae bacterium]
MKTVSKIVSLLWLGMLLGCSAGETSKFAPVNPNASDEARQLLSFLYSIQGTYTLTAQHNFVSDLAKYDQIVTDITGKTPVVWGSDFSFNSIGDDAGRYQHCGPMNLTVPFDGFGFNGRSTDDLRQGMIDEAIRQHRNGRIITLMWHECFPTEGDSCNGSSIWAMENRPSPEVWKELVTEGTELNTQWKRQVDNVAGYLKQLQDAKVPVLWRPYHEMNGVWFWWCNHPGDEGFKKLWIMMYDYFTNHHKLNNLIWVWNTNAPRDTPGDEAFPYDQFFPGVEYVDVLAADVYGRDYKQSHHDDLYTLGGGKLIALGEVGQLPTVEQYEAQPYWSWMMPWGYFINGFGNSPEVVNAIYNDPRTLTLDELDFSKQTYKLKK